MKKLAKSFGNYVSIGNILLALIFGVFVSADTGYAQTFEDDLKKREEQCGMTYELMQRTEFQFQALCIQAFSLQCMKKQALSPSYREQHPQVTDQQLEQGIQDIEKRMRVVCAQLRPRMRERCVYCQQ